MATASSGAATMATPALKAVAGSLLTTLSQAASAVKPWISRPLYLAKSYFYSAA